MKENQLKEHDMVKVITGHFDVPAGTVGAIIHIYEGHKTCDIEFIMDTETLTSLIPMAYLEKLEG